MHIHEINNKNRVYIYHFDNLVKAKKIETKNIVDKNKVDKNA